MTYSILHFANFAHAEMAAIGAFITLFLFNTLGLNFLISIILTMVLVGLMAIMIDNLVFKKLRGAKFTTLMISSLGISIALRNGVRAVWGSSIRSYDLPVFKPMYVLGARIAPIQIGVITIALVLMILLHLLLKKTTLGKSMRATADSPVLAQACGIATEKVIKWTWFVGGSYAAVGGILIAADTQLSPSMGFEMVIPVFAAAILGGLGNPYGAFVGALIIGLAENFGVSFDFGKIFNLGGLIKVGGHFYIPSSFKPGIGFVILIITLLIKPSGIFGSKGGK